MVLNLNSLGFTVDTNLYQCLAVNTFGFPCRLELQYHISLLKFDGQQVGKVMYRGLVVKWGCRKEPIIMLLFNGIFRWVVNWS
jgi:hypothetical protein